MSLRYVGLLTVVAMLAGASVGCGDDNPAENNANNGADIGVDADVGDDGGGDDADSGPIDTQQPAPVITNVVVTENPNSVLSAFVEFETDEQAVGSVEITSDDGSHSFTVFAADEMPVTSHSIDVVGLRPETEYTFRLVATDSDEHRGTTQETFTTGALPDDFPPIDVTSAETNRMQSGVTLMTVSRWGDAGLHRPWGYLIGVDETGAVVWYHKAEHHPYEAIVLSNGNVAYVAGHDAIVEIDWMGETVDEWAVEQLGIDTVHHELLEMPNGNLVTMSSEMRVIDGYDDGNGGTTSHNVVGDTIVEFDRDGNVLGEWSTFDMIDPMRQRLGFNAGFWNYDYDQVESTKDWTHGNAVEYDPSDDSFIISLRHQDWLVKFSRVDGSVIWKLGEEGDFLFVSGVGSSEWQFHQHAPELQDNGSILLYDNGNGRTGTDPNNAYSRAVQFEVDTDAMEVTPVWEYRSNPDFYSPYVSDADMMANGNVLITDGGRLANDALPLEDPENQKWGRIIEVDGDEVVFELVIRDDAETDPADYFIYRAEKLDSFPGASTNQ